MKENLRRIINTIIGSGIVAGLSVNVIAQSVTVTDITDWGTTPNEVVTLDLPDLGYPNGVGVYAGINTLSVSENGSTGTFSGFCIDPFHFSLSGPQDYSIVSLAEAPKPPGPMGTAAAMAIEDLWAMDFATAQHSASAAAALQIAIWEEVVDGVTSQNHEPASDYFSISPSNPYAIEAAADIAALKSYTGPAADLVGLTGAGQDYVIDAPPTGNTVPVPDRSATAVLLGAALLGIEGFRRKFGCLV
jgi:hypothetical protein